MNPFSRRAPSPSPFQPPVPARAAAFPPGVQPGMSPGMQPPPPGSMQPGRMMAGMVGMAGMAGPGAGAARPALRTPPPPLGVVEALGRQAQRRREMLLGMLSALADQTSKLEEGFAELGQQCESVSAPLAASRPEVVGIMRLHFEAAHRDASDVRVGLEQIRLMLEDAVSIQTELEDRLMLTLGRFFRGERPAGLRSQPQQQPQQQQPQQQPQQPQPQMRPQQQMRQPPPARASLMRRPQSSDSPQQQPQPQAARTVIDPRSETEILRGMRPSVVKPPPAPPPAPALEQPQPPISSPNGAITVPAESVSVVARDDTNTTPHAE